MALIKLKYSCTGSHSYPVIESSVGNWLRFHNQSSEIINFFKSTLHEHHTFFVHFFTVVLHDYGMKLPETSWLHILWRKCHTFSCSLFFHCCSFSPWWLLALSPMLQNVHVVPPTKMSPLFFLSRPRSFSR